MAKNQDTPSARRYDAIVTELDRRFRKAGYGSRIAALRGLGLSENYLTMANQRRSLKLKVLLDLVESVGTNLPEIALASDRRVGEWRREPPAGDVPPSVERVLLEALELDLSEELFIEGETRSSSGHTLDDLNSLRLEDPQSCLEELLTFPTAGLGRLQRIEYLTLLGATFRRLVRLPEANHALHSALDLCRPADSHSIQADILLKLAHLEYEYGRLHRALWLTERAVLWFELDQNESGVGEALLNYAMWSHLAGHLDDAFAALQAAESKLDPDNANLRFMHCLGMATVLESRGEPQKALHYQERGLRLAGAVGKTLRPSLFITGGRLKVQLGDSKSATQQFLEARDAYLEIDRPISAALAVILAIEVLIEQNAQEHAVEIALGMMRLVWTLAEVSPMAESTVGELIKHVQKSRKLGKEHLRQVKLELETIEAQMEAERRKAWR